MTQLTAWHQSQPAAAPRAWLPLHGRRSLLAARQLQRPAARPPNSSATVSAARLQTVAVSAATAGAQPSSSGGKGDGDAAPARCPLHACLREYGISDLAPFSGARHLAMTQVEVDAEVRLKLADLAAEGLRPGDLAALVAKKDFPLTRGYADIFRPNLALLRDILRHCNEAPRPDQAHLSALGRRLVGGPTFGALVLGRDPGKIQQLLGWAERELGVSRAELATSRSLFHAVYASCSAAEAVRQLLVAEFGCSREAVASMFLASPQLFRLKPALLLQKAYVLQRELSVDFPQAVSLIDREPRLLSIDLKARLPSLLAFLDAYMGEAGAGRRLVLKSPILGSFSHVTAAREVAALERLGFDQAAIRAMIAEYPGMLMQNAGSAAQQQKRDWFEQVSPWSAKTLNASPRLRGASLRRLASRLDFMLSHGLEPYSPESLACMSDAVFSEKVARKHKCATGGNLPATEWGAWQAAWLQTPAGRRWGFPPLPE